MTREEIEQQVVEGITIPTVKEMIKDMSDEELTVYLLESGMINLLLSFKKRN